MGKKSRHLLSLLAGAAALAVGPAPVLADPVLVELFTSQGCSSCPPADEFLGELTQRKDVIALAYHVDYWDYIGWRDKFARPENTARQKDYRDALGLHTIYTPQMVVDGRYDVVGSQRSEVESSIASAAAEAKLLIAVVENGGKLRVTAPPMRIDQAKPASLWLAVYSRRNETPVSRGENSGSILVEYNIVQELRRLGPWTGNAIDMELDMNMADKNMGCAVILQVDGNGPILGVAAAQ
ncbi:MAG TPA: DUF1223 domain-containing protein [Verrucomicrobiae bacterium]|nr:DUF1223 domain-containing protein [Verrucomicrobiae bacterium]